MFTAQARGMLCDTSVFKQTKKGGEGRKAHTADEAFAIRAAQGKPTVRRRSELEPEPEPESGPKRLYHPPTPALLPLRASNTRSYVLTGLRTNKR